MTSIPKPKKPKHGKVRKLENWFQALRECKVQTQHTPSPPRSPSSQTAYVPSAIDYVAVPGGWVESSKLRRIVDSAPCGVWTPWNYKLDNGHMMQEQTLEWNHHEHLIDLLYEKKTLRTKLLNSRGEYQSARVYIDVQNAIRWLFQTLEYQNLIESSVSFGVQNHKTDTKINSTAIDDTLRGVKTFNIRLNKNKRQETVKTLLWGHREYLKDILDGDNKTGIKSLSTPNGNLKARQVYRDVQNALEWLSQTYEDKDLFESVADFGDSQTEN